MGRALDQHSNVALNCPFAEQEGVGRAFALIRLTLQFSSDKNSLGKVLGRRIRAGFQNHNPIYAIHFAD